MARCIFLLKFEKKVSGKNSQTIDCHLILKYVFQCSYFPQQEPVYARYCRTFIHRTSPMHGYSFHIRRLDPNNPDAFSHQVVSRYKLYAWVCLITKNNRRPLILYSPMSFPATKSKPSLVIYWINCNFLCKDPVFVSILKQSSTNSSRINTTPCSFIKCMLLCFVLIRFHGVWEAIKLRPKLLKVKPKLSWTVAIITYGLETQHNMHPLK